MTMLHVNFSDGSKLDVEIKFFETPLSSRGCLYYERPFHCRGCGDTIPKDEVDNFYIYLDIKPDEET